VDSHNHITLFVGEDDIWVGGCVVEYPFDEGYCDKAVGLAWAAASELRATTLFHGRTSQVAQFEVNIN
jgi:hypothetical protein